MSTSYPGPDPDDPFAKPPNESGPSSSEAGATPPSEETAPIQPGYWERLAQQGQPGTPPADPGGSTPYGSQGPATSAYGDQPAGSWSGYGSAPGGPAYPPPAYTGYVRPQQPQAMTAMVLGLVSLVGGFLSCGLLFLVAPFAWAVGARSKREIAASNGQLGGEGNAQAGFVMGIIGTVLLVLAIVGVALIIGLIVAGSSSGGYDSTTTF